MANLFDDGWSTSAGSNTTVDGVSVAEGMQPDKINNAIRGLMSVIRQTFASALKTFFDGTAPLPVANGGTGVTTLAGILSAIGGLEDDYRDLPKVTKTGAFTFSPSERSYGIEYTGAAAAATINPDATTPWANSNVCVVVIRNNGSGALTITRGSGVSLKRNGSATSADAVLAVGGRATLERWGANDFVITGTGIS